MKERTPIDKYSRDEYEEGLKKLSREEGKIKDHPLQAEVALHEELRKESPVPYPLAKDEEKARFSLEEETAVFQKEVDTIKRDLWRQLGNAQTEATKTNDDLMSRELARAVLPLIGKIRDNTLQKMSTAENLSGRARVFGRAVLDEVETAQQQITSKKPTPAPEAIHTSFKVIQELYTQFTKFAGDVLSQNRYGRDAASPTAL